MEEDHMEVDKPKKPKKEPSNYNKYISDYIKTNYKGGSREEVRKVFKEATDKWKSKS